MKFKLAIVLSCLLFLSGTSLYGQSAVLVKDKFAIELPQNKVELAPGASEDVSILIGRGKKYASEAVEFIVNNPPAGITVKFEQPETTADKNNMTITAAEDLAPGTYMLVIYGRIDQTRKGVAVSVKVN
jgi:hypothetical protein